MDIRELSVDERVLTTCPVFVYGDELNPCGQKLQVIYTRTIVGDDYGDWPLYDVFFRCGHNLEQMRTSLRYGHEI